MSLEQPRHVLTTSGNTVCQCPHCRRLITVRPEVLADPLFFAKDGLYRGFAYRMPPLLHDAVAGTGAALAGLSFAYYNFQRALAWAERTVPQTPARPILLPLVAFPPLILATAVVAGVGKGVLPAFVELTTQLFLAPAEAIQGAVNDVKKTRIAARARTDTEPDAKQ